MLIYVSLHVDNYPSQTRSTKVGKEVNNSTSREQIHIIAFQ